MLTSRQKEFLQVATYHGRSGIHYTKVAELMGVSRWTAYDILTYLSNKGLLEKKRIPKKSSTAGRSRVLFYPTSRANVLVFGSDVAQRADSGCKEWEEACSRLRSKLGESRERGIFPVLSEIIQELSSVKRPLIFCAHLIVVMLLALRLVSSGPEGSLWINSLVPLLIGPQAALLVFTGAVVTYILQHQPVSSLKSEVLQHLPTYERQAKKLDALSEKVLLNFTMDVIEELWPPQLKSKADCIT